MKKLVCFLAVLLFCFSAAPAAEASADTTCLANGDLNADGLPLSVGDLSLMVRVLTGEAPRPDNLYEVDFTGDCRVDSADLNLLEDFFIYGPIIFVRNPLPVQTCCNPTLVTICAAAKGDLDGDGSASSSDVVLMLNCAFLGTGNCSLCFADLNCDGGLTGADVVQELNYAFLGTPPDGCP